MSKIYCTNCKYYKFNPCNILDGWCNHNDEKTGAYSSCEREFENLEEATRHYNIIVKENEEHLFSKFKIAFDSKEKDKQITELQHKLEVAERTIKLACIELYCKGDGISICDYCPYSTNIEDMCPDECPQSTELLIKHFREQAEKELKGE